MKETYSPLSDFSWLHQILLEPTIYGDLEIFESLGIIPKKDDEGYYCDTRLFVAKDLLQRSKNIMNMQVKTLDDWQEVKDDFVCPECGSYNLDID